MFENLSARLGQTLRKLTGQGRLTEANIQETLREIRLALLEADVALPVVKAFIASIEERAVGQEVINSLTPGQTLIKIVHEALIAALGSDRQDLQLQAKPPVVILVAGLQGSGKTTTIAKLARYLKERERRSVAVVSADVYRPAAIEQLQVLAYEVGAEFFASQVGEDPATIVKRAHGLAEKQFIDVLLVDTAGRLHIDEAMMQEIKALHQIVQPTETLFVVDSMTGQDAANTARAFHEALPLTGVILTKTDGDARGGAALSVRHITGCAIKFLGVGEKTDALEPFYPDRIASRILGMGDVLSLVEDVERKIDKQKAQKLAEKISKGKGFDLEDFKQQLLEMKKLGGMGSLLEKLPGMGAMAKQAQMAVQTQFGDQQLKRMEAMINSMTIKERRFPDHIKGSHKKRIASGSGTQIQEVNRLLRQFDDMQRMTKKLGSQGGLKKMMRSAGAMLGRGGMRLS